MSNMVRHAEEELRRAGLFDKDSDYGGMLAEAVMRLVETHAAERHSGASNGLALEVFERVASFKTLSPITNDPGEWVNVSDRGGPDMAPVWQNRRDPSLFSNDGGKTYYSVEDPGRQMRTALDPKDAKSLISPGPAEQKFAAAVRSMTKSGQGITWDQEKTLRQALGFRVVPSDHPTAPAA